MRLLAVVACAWKVAYSEDACDAVTEDELIRQDVHDVQLLQLRTSIEAATDVPIGVTVGDGEGELHPDTDGLKMLAAEVASRDLPIGVLGGDDEGELRPESDGSKILTADVVLAKFPHADVELVHAMLNGTFERPTGESLVETGHNTTDCGQAVQFTYSSGTTSCNNYCASGRRYHIWPQSALSWEACAAWTSAMSGGLFGNNCGDYKTMFYTAANPSGSNRGPCKCCLPGATVYKSSQGNKIYWTP